MCQETDEPHKKHGDDLEELPIHLPDPKPALTKPVDCIKLPYHKTGKDGDPLNISGMDQLQDLDLSEMSAK